jgi:hypothetical protein
MSLLRSHLVLMLLYASAAGAFFALLWKTTRSERLRLFVTIFLSLFLGGMAVAWAMYPFPIR